MKNKIIIVMFYLIKIIFEPFFQIIISYLLVCRDFNFRFQNLVMLLFCALCVIVLNRILIKRFPNKTLIIYKYKNIISMNFTKAMKESKLFENMSKDLEEIVKYAKKSNIKEIQFATHFIFVAYILGKYYNVSTRNIKEILEKSRNEEVMYKDLVICFTKRKYNPLNICNKDLRIEKIVAKQDFYKITMNIK